MTTVKEFCERWEDVETGLINMTASPLLATRTLAENHLKELYVMKKTLDSVLPKQSTKIRGLNTEVFGRVTFEQIEKFVNDYCDISSEKYMLINNGAGFSDKYTEENLKWFIERGYLPDNNKIKENKK